MSKVQVKEKSRTPQVNKQSAYSRFVQSNLMHPKKPQQNLFSSKHPVKAISNMRATKDIAKNKTSENINAGAGKFNDLSLSDQDMPLPIVPQPISQEVMASPVQSHQSSKEPEKASPAGKPSKSVVPPVSLPTTLNVSWFGNSNTTNFYIKSQIAL